MENFDPHMEELAEKQSDIGSKLEQLLRNFRKDSEVRKTEDYLNKRLEVLESYQLKFEETHQELIVFQETHQEHPYFKNNYDTEIRKLCATIKTRLLEAKANLLPEKSIPTTSSDTTATTSTATTSAATANPQPRQNPTMKKRENPNDFKLNYEQEFVASPDDATEKLVRKQKALMKRLTLFIQDIEAKRNQDHSKPYYDLKLSWLHNYEAEMSQNDQLIWELSDDERPCGYEAGLYHELNCWTQDTIIMLQQQLSSLNDHADRTMSTQLSNNQVKLPKIVLPTFDGNYLRWTQFHDLYVQLIHNQPISKAQKMFYLSSNLTGEARSLIQHLPISNENYEDAWNTINNRYNNKRLLVTALLNKLLSQPTSQVESATSIKALHDTTKECLLGLKNLGLEIDSWDPFLTHILIKKFDKCTHTLYEQSLAAPRELNSIKKVLEFLETRFQSLEALGGRPHSSHRDKHHQGNHHQSKSSAFVTTTNANNCIACNQNHELYACKIFLSQSPSKRYQLLKKNNLCINCMRGGHAAMKCTLRGCTRCSKKHNTLVHLDETKPSPRGSQPARAEPLLPAPLPTTTHNQASPSNGQFQGNSSTTLAAQAARTPRGYVLLSTVIVKLKNNEGREVECRAVLDSGSQLNIITSRLVKRLALRETSDPLTIQGIGQNVQNTQHRVNLTLKSRTTGFSTRIEAFVLPRIATHQPAQLLDITAWSIPKNIELADPEFYIPKHVDLLIGAENYFELLSIGQIKLGTNLPTLQNTVLGWVLAGRVLETTPSDAVCGICTQEDSKLDEQVERFWRLEETEAITPQMTASELKCESHFNQTMQRNEHGRFVVRLPFAQDPGRLGESKDIAVRRFHSLERKLDKNPHIKTQYVEFMNEYISLGHMKEVNLKNISKPYYFLPHHCVMKPESTSTKLRVVFDASMKTSSNIALNEILHKGPTLQDELFTILLRFRQPRFVFTADIEKMYRQVLLDKDDWRYHMILWRKEPCEPIRYYQLCTVTYGVTTAPYLATKCLQRLASQTSERFPLGSKALKHDFYVDDVMTGSDSLKETLELQDQLNQILQSAGFKLRKWCANHPALVQGIPSEDRAPQLELHDDKDCEIKTLGLTWLPKTDEFCIKTQWNVSDRVTKRRALSDIAHLFDPLGIMSPVVIRAKIFLQKLWTLKLDWDAAIPAELHTYWNKFREDLRVLNDIKIPRHVYAGKKAQKMELHTFSDASEKAYGAAIYVRSTLQDGTVLVRLLCAKSKVAPTKTTTLPRLELCAAKLAAQLTHRVKGDLKWDHASYFWTDSEIVLAWLNSPSASFHTFVANRVAAIQEVTSTNQWRHVPSTANPADLVSRGISPEKLKTCNLWFYGPLFLHGTEALWPSRPSKLETDLERKQSKVTLSAISGPTDVVESIDHRNSFKHLQRVIALVMRFIRNCRQRDINLRKTSHLTVTELEEALIIIVKKTQKQGFKETITELQRTGYVNPGSCLSSLSPFLDDNGVLRVGGRLEEATMAYDTKHPMLLPYDHINSRLLMTYLHNINSHIGAQGLLAVTRQRFWPIKGKTIARSIVQKCVRCSRAKPKLLGQFMGNLPADRVQPARPFVNAGVDFCGPFWTHYKIRGKRPQKSYVAIFCCFATKAVHIEIVSDLTTEAFIGALKRFVSRRGNCRRLYCDNATNFVGASNQLQELQQVIHSKNSEEKISNFCSARGIDFQFIPPRAPHFGGLWEAAVKSAKHLFRRSVSAASLTYEELGTVMTEIEAILNSRPITPMSSSPNDLTALTPGHFLIGEPLTSIVDPHAQPSKTTLPQRWKLVSQLKREFWHRWSREYLSELQHRYKWKERCNNVQQGTMVVVKDDNLPILSWPLGRIIRTIKGDDGLVRVADVKTATGVLRRPIHKLAPLPVEQSDAEQPNHIQPTCDEESKPLTKTPSVVNQSEGGIHEDREHEQNNQGPPRTKKRRCSASTVGAFLLTCLVLPIFVSGDSQVDILPFKTQPGIYFEGMGSTELVTNEWSLVVYYDMRPYWRELTTIVNGISTLDTICNTLKEKQLCTQVTSQFHTIIEVIKNNNELLTIHTTARIKRAPLDIIGSIANSLFGVLDSNYASKMSEIINSLEGNQQHLLALLKNQTSLIDSTANIMKNSNEAVERQLQEFEGYINQSISQINGIHQELHEQRATEIFNTLSITLILTIANYQKTQSMLLDVVIDTHHGKVNPLLLTPKQLQEQLTLIKENLPSTVRLPTNRNSLLELYSLMTIEGRVANAQIIFRLKMPLFSYESFEMLRVVPVPVPINDTFLIIQPSSRYIVINLHRDQYYPLSEQEVTMCSNIGQSIHMCKQRHPLYRKGSNISSCEIGFLSQTPNPSFCKISRTNEAPRWIQLFNPNHWIYTMKDETTINIVCGNAVFQRTLTASGIINITSGCAIKDEFTTIQAQNFYPSVLRTSLLPTRNLTDLLPPSEVSEMLHEPFLHKNMSRDILDLKDRIKQLREEETLPKTTYHQEIHQFSIGYLSLSLTLVILLYLGWRIHSKRQNQVISQHPIPAPRRTTSEFRIDTDLEL